MKDFISTLYVLAHSKPITHREITEMNKVRGRVKFPYEETVEILNSLKPDEWDKIPEIISMQERKVWKKCGIKKLIGMVNRDMRNKMKELFNL